MEPTCSLSLVLQKMGIYEDTKEFCSWLETAEWFDCRGPNDTAEWLGVDRESMAKLNSPLDVTLMQAFAKQSEHHSGEPVWEVMKMIGSDLLSYVTNLRARMDQVAQVEQVWDLGGGDQGIKVAFVPRTDSPIEDASGALAWRIKELKLEEEVVATVYPDSRGKGMACVVSTTAPFWISASLRTNPRFILLTPAGSSRRRVARKSSDSRNCFSWPGPDALSRYGHEVGVDQPAPEDEDLRQEVQDDAVFFPGKAHHAPSTGPDHVNDDVERMNVQGMKTNCG